MHFAWTFPLLGLFGLVIPIARAEDHQVTVGGIGILKYDPEFLNANPGDTVTFVFKQKNHTVTQSTLDAPCVKAPDGFDSGFVPVPDEQTSNFTVAKFTVSDTTPIWVYCRQANHCQQGMVFAINPGDKFDQYKANAVGNSTTASTTGAAGVVTVTQTVTVNGTPQTTTYATTTAAAAPTESASGAVVTVGMNGALQFTPNTLAAKAGDKITFRFTSKNHTVTQSSFADPCTPLAETSANGQAGFDSGFVPVAAGATTVPEFTITVNDTAPIWVYCKQADHCKQGMVFAINPPATGNTFDAFLANAKGAAAPSGSGNGNGAASTRRSGAIVAALAIAAVALL